MVDSDVEVFLDDSSHGNDVRSKQADLDDNIQLLETTVTAYRDRLSFAYQNMLQYEDFLFYCKRLNERCKQEMSLWKTTLYEVQAGDNGQLGHEEFSRLIIDHQKIEEGLNTSVYRSLMGITSASSSVLGGFLEKYKQTLRDLTEDPSSNPLKMLGDVEEQIIRHFESLVKSNKDLQEFCNSSKRFQKEHASREKKTSNESGRLRQQKLEFPSNSHKTHGISSAKVCDEDYDEVEYQSHFNDVPPVSRSKQLGIDRQLSFKNHQDETGSSDDACGNHAKRYRKQDSDPEFNPDSDIETQNTRRKKKSLAVKNRIENQEESDPFPWLEPHKNTSNVIFKRNLPNGNDRSNHIKHGEGSECIDLT